MREIAYQALLGAPSRVVGTASGVAGFIGSVWPDRVKAVLGSGIPVQPISIGLLASAVVYFALLWLLKPSGKPGEGGPTTLTSGGPYSPNFGSVTGNVTINHSSAPAPEPQKSGYDWNNVDALTRILTDGGSRRPEVVLRKSEPRRQCPESPIWWAIHRIAARIGENNSAEGFPEARRQLRQAAREGLEIWGQEQIPPQERIDVDRHRDVHSPIPEAYWQLFRLVPEAAKEGLEDAAHTEEEASPNALVERYWNLRVDKAAINWRWRKPDPPITPIPSMKTGWSRKK